MVLMDALALLAQERPRIALDLSSGETVAGRLGSVGAARGRRPIPGLLDLLRCGRHGASTSGGRHLTTW